MDGLAAPLVGDSGARVVRGRPFWKMTGSGNDFVFFDAREDPPGELESTRAIGAVCDRRRGVGADGVVFLEKDPECAFGIRYFNRDGSLAELCGNASLCSVTLAAHLGVVSPAQDFVFRTSSGPLTGRRSGGASEIDMPLVADEQVTSPIRRETGEKRIAFARVGVPHLVVLVDDIESVAVSVRGRDLRHDTSLPAGANANFVATTPRGWRMRTYERGVEEETLACGSGAVACAWALDVWGLAGDQTRLVTSSGEELAVRFRNAPEGRIPSLSGEGRLVFSGTLEDVSGAE